MALQQIMGGQSTSDLATLAANASGSGIERKLRSAYGARSYRALNTTIYQIYVYGDDEALIDVIPAGAFLHSDLRQPTSFLSFVFNPDFSGQTGAQTSTTAWGVWAEAYREGMGSLEMAA